MSHQMMIETSIFAFAAFAGFRFVAQQRYKLERMNRGLRLLNHIVDRANEREAASTQTGRLNQAA